MGIHTGAIGCIVIMHVLLMLDEEHGHVVSYSVLFQCAVLPWHDLFQLVEPS